MMTQNTDCRVRDSLFPLPPPNTLEGQAVCYRYVTSMLYFLTDGQHYYKVGIGTDFFDIAQQALL